MDSSGLEGAQASGNTFILFLVAAVDNSEIQGKKQVDVCKP
jgi:hypothetical protein